MAAVEGFHAGSINITLNRIRFKVMDVVIRCKHVCTKRMIFYQCFYLPVQKYCISF